MRSVWGREKIQNSKHNFRSQGKNTLLALSNPESTQTKNSSQYSSVQFKMSTRFSRSSLEDKKSHQNLLVLSMRRVIFRNIGLCFKKIKERRVSNFTLTLLASKKQRLLAQAFSNIRNFLNQRSMLRVQNNLNRKKKCEFMYFILSRILNKTKKVCFANISSSSGRANAIKEFSRKIIGILRPKYGRMQKQAAMRVFCQKISADSNKKRGVQDLFYAVARNSRKRRQQSLKTLLKFCFSSEIQKVKAEKKQINGKMIVYSSEKVKAIMAEKEKVWNLKQGVDSESTDKNKIKNDLIRNAAFAKNKAKEQKKIFLKIIRELQHKNEVLKGKKKILSERKVSSEKILSTFLQKEEDVCQLYRQIYKEEANENGQIKPGFFKQYRLKIKTELFPCDSYHLYKNQRLKQEIMVYEKQKRYRDRQKTVSESLILGENETLKEIVKLIMSRKVESFRVREAIQI